ncbi:MAG TPA: CinA family protein, partial [Methylomirabilota bacterium]|nr:CinA family protein [Methylomirabilota bacterium]
HVFAVGGAILDTDFPAHAAAVLAGHGLHLAAAEVASAGRLDDLLALTGDGARCLAGGLVAPREAVLAEQLGLDTTDAETIARAVRERFGADLGVAVLGSAAGGDGRPPGTLVIAAATATAAVRRELCFPIDADRFQLLAAYGGLQLALRLVADEPA